MEDAPEHTHSVKVGTLAEPVRMLLELEHCM